jgi:hypothetical protein
VRTDQLEQLGLHGDLGVNQDGKLEPTVEFDWSAVEAVAEPDDSITWADASSLLFRVLQFITAPDELAKAGARAHLVVYLLDPSECRYSSLRELANEVGVTKQALSRALMRFRQDVLTRSVRFF